MRQKTPDNFLPHPMERISPYKKSVNADIPPDVNVVRKSYEHPINMAYRVDELL